MWYLTLANEIRRDYGCFDYSKGPNIQVDSCHMMGGNQDWDYRVVSYLIDYRNNQCKNIKEPLKYFTTNTTCLSNYSEHSERKTSKCQNVLRIKNFGYQVSQQYPFKKILCVARH